MIYTYLMNTLIFCAILLLLALIVGAVQMAIIMVDIRKMTREFKDKFMAVSSVLDIVGIVIGGLTSSHKKGVPDGATVAGFAAGLKKALQVLFKK
ncbi:MAG: hypothetical protein PHH14_07245 [Candidatus Margulisbacteria bacterium]|nr:hypothetical protein [Candidatus Margulisiibacteriota bacterium]